MCHGWAKIFFAWKWKWLGLLWWPCWGLSVLRITQFTAFERSLNPSLWLPTSLEWNLKLYCITLWVFDVLVGGQWRCRRDWRVPAQSWSWGSPLYLGEEQSSFLGKALESSAALLFFIRTGGTTSAGLSEGSYQSGLVGGIPAHGKGGWG